MFKRTQIRLTLLNSLIFVVLIGVLGFTIYSYMQNRLYNEVDNSLLMVTSHQNQQPTHRIDEHLKPSYLAFTRDPRIDMMIRDSNNQIISTKGDVGILMQNESSIMPKQLDTIYEIKVENYTFRTLAVKDDNTGITLQVFRNVDSEINLLNRLLLIMLIGCGGGVLFAVAAGYFLARRALVPIQTAWEKQQQFVSDASHELRTPLAVIQSKTDLLFRAPSATIQDKAFDISVISKECRRLSKLVSNLLTLARSDSNQVEIERKEFNINEMLDDIIHSYEDLALYQDKSLLLQTEANIKFIGDKEKLHQLLVILLDNALKYTNQGGTITLSCSQTLSTITLQVKDDGIGIAEEDLSKIFDRFYQSDKARTLAQGAGLGLSIAKWIVEKHHGKIKVHSQLGKGTSFEIILPKNKKK
ncbi:sensor histidine kinase [Ectobacillus polymachus]|uniref:sensor histidine kinase n=1 Tax=Ectobacillus polymachus TaxID=1508806 RepID=UPI003A8A438F